MTSVQLQGIHRVYMPSPSQPHIKASVGLIIAWCRQIEFVIRAGAGTPTPRIGTTGTDRSARSAQLARATEQVSRA